MISDLFVKILSIISEKSLRKLKTKRQEVDPISIYEILSSFPIDKLDLVKWIKKPEAEIFKKEIVQIAEDIMYGKVNSLA